MKRKLASSGVNHVSVNVIVHALILSYDRGGLRDAEHGVQSESDSIKLCGFGFQAESPKTVWIRCDLRACAERD